MVIWPESASIWGNGSRSKGSRKIAPAYPRRVITYSDASLGSRFDIDLDAQLKLVAVQTLKSDAIFGITLHRIVDELGERKPWSIVQVTKNR